MTDKEEEEHTHKLIGTITLESIIKNALIDLQDLPKTIAYLNQELYSYNYRVISDEEYVELGDINVNIPK